MPPQNTETPPAPLPSPPPQSNPSPTPPPQGSDGLIGMTGSQLVPEKQPVPKGIFVVAGLAALGFGFSFFDTSQNSLLYTIILLADLLLTIGLFFRLETVRKLTLWLAGLTVVLSLILIVGLVGLEGRIRTLRGNYDTAVAKLPTNLTPAQQEQLDAMNALINEAEEKTGKSMQLAYIKNGITIVSYLAVIVYLTRPKVKAAFRDKIG